MCSQDVPHVVSQSQETVVWDLQESVPVIGDLASGVGAQAATITSSVNPAASSMRLGVSRFGTETVLNLTLEEKAGGRTVVSGELETTGQYAPVQLASMWNNRWYSRVQQACEEAEHAAQGKLAGEAEG